MSSEQPKRLNSRITAKDRGTIKGSLRRAFARSDLHQAVLSDHAIEHRDPKKPRCLKWCWCGSCGVVFPRWQAAVDHREPLIPVDRSFEEMSMDEVIDRLWCPREGLQVLCEACHHEKSLGENKQRREHKKQRKALK